jgi:GET complex subunit GET2
MDAKTLREKRQARIKAGGADRLAKITKTYSNADYKDHKVPSGYALNQEEGSQNDDQTSGISGESLTANSGELTKSENLFPSASLEDSNISPEAMNDPLFRLLAEMKAAVPESGAETPLNGAGANPMEAFSSLFASLPQFQGEDSQIPTQGQALQTQKSLSWRRDFLWPLIHVVLCIFLALHNLQSDSAQSLVWQFCTLELMLHTGRFVIERGAPPSISIFTTIAGYLPDPFKTYLITVARYLHIGKSVVQDLCVVLFIIGLFGSSDGSGST